MSAFLNLFSGLNWWRVGAGVVLGLAVFFGAQFIWVTRPAEFYVDGVRAAQAQCLINSKTAEIEARKNVEENQTQRAKILARPHSRPDVLLGRMRDGNL